MLKKYGKFYADWRDHRGHRRMKAFPTKVGALRYQTKMRDLTERKKARASATLRSSRKRGLRPKQAHGTPRAARSPKTSPLSAANSNPTT